MILCRHYADDTIAGAVATALPSYRAEPTCNARARSGFIGDRLPGRVEISTTRRAFLRSLIVSYFRCSSLPTERPVCFSASQTACRDLRTVPAQQVPRASVHSQSTREVARLGAAGLSSACREAANVF